MICGSPTSFNRKVFVGDACSPSLSRSLAHFHSFSTDDDDAKLFVACFLCAFLCECALYFPELIHFAHDVAKDTSITFHATL